MEKAKSKSKSRKLEDFSESVTRSGRQRLNENGDFKGPFNAPVTDLRVHRVFSSVSTGDLDDVDDSSVVKKVFRSGVVGNLCQNGVIDRSEVVDKCFQTTPPDEVLAKSKIVDGSKKDSVAPSNVSCPQVAGRRSPGSRSLKRCSRTKLFGNPSSFSYRRLLPYLMDITKGALKSLEMKPQLPTNAMNSVIERSMSRLEPNPNVGDGTDLSPQRQGIVLLKISEPIICTENTADTTVPINPEVPVSTVTCNLSKEHTEISVNKNDELSQSEAGKVMVVLCDMNGFSEGRDAFDIVSSEAINNSDSVDSATQHSADENISDKLDVLEDSPFCESLGLGHVSAVETNDVNYDEPRSNICEKNATEVGQETPLDELGIVTSVLKPIIPNKRNSDHAQLVSEANCNFSVEAISGSSFADSTMQLSPGKNRGEQTNVVGDDALSCKHLHLSVAHEAKENAVYLEEPQSTLSSESKVDLVHTTTVMNEDIVREDVTETMKSVSNLENILDDGVITNTENSVGEQLNGTADNKQSTSSERKLHLKPRRLKKFKNYNSVSYRKLLPFLTEIYEDIEGSSKKGQVKIVVAPAIVHDSMKKSHPTSVSGTTLPGYPSPVSADVKPQMTKFDCISEQATVAASPIESHLENELKPLNDLQCLSNAQVQPIQDQQPSCGPNNMCIGQFIAKSQWTASKYKEEDLARSKKHSDDSNLSNFVPVYPEPISPFVSPTKGILKKNPRGCRGLCTCLKCASFRLHAEKAFEFSRSQLLDSEEIALDLINELSVLRNLLKKSVDADSRKVHEACNNAHSIEQQAKARLEQMNHDLQIHCQIPNLQRPNVSFARCIEEKMIQAPHSPS